MLKKIYKYKVDRHSVYGYNIWVCKIISGKGNHIMLNTALLLTSGSTGGNNGGGLIMTIIMIVAFIAIFFFSTRSQRKQEKEIAVMRNNLQVGDEITTIGGIIGKIVSIKEETCVIETSRDGTKIRFLKSAISRVDVTAEDAAAATKDTEAK